MKLQNILKHMKNESVKCNGTRYELDADGVTDVEKPEDAKKLLMDRSAWKHYSLVEPDVEPEQIQKPKHEPIPEPETVSEPIPDHIPEPETITSTDTTTEVLLDSEQDTTSNEVVLNTDTDTDTDLDAEYPDPTIKNTMKELKSLAKIYEVSFKDQPNKKELIDRIMDAMYPKE